MGEPDEWGQGDETELGATVVPTTRQVYRYRCASCDIVGDFWDSEGEAQQDGLYHEHAVHPRVYTIEAVGTYD